jgi:hypothetical protein
MELAVQFMLPLFGELWRAEHRNPGYFSPVEKLTGD